MNHSACFKLLQMTATKCVKHILYRECIFNIHTTTATATATATTTISTMHCYYDYDYHNNQSINQSINQSDIINVAKIT